MSLESHELTMCDHDLTWVKCFQTCKVLRDSILSLMSNVLTMLDYSWFADMKSTISRKMLVKSQLNLIIYPSQLGPNSPFIPLSLMENCHSMLDPHWGLALRRLLSFLALNLVIQMASTFCSQWVLMPWASFGNMSKYRTQWSKQHYINSNLSLNCKTCRV